MKFLTLGSLYLEYFFYFFRKILKLHIKIKFSRIQSISLRIKLHTFFLGIAIYTLQLRFSYYTQILAVAIFFPVWNREELRNQTKADPCGRDR